MGDVVSTSELIARTEAHGARNYAPLPVVLDRGEGCWVWDVEGRRFLDLLSAYSALSHGHRHPRLLSAIQRQLDRLTLTSRAFYHDQLAPFCERLSDLTGLPRVLPMNTGVEAVETALKAVRKWAYVIKGIARGEARIVVCRNNFHGRTITVVSFSSQPQYRDAFGPLTPGFDTVDFADVQALERVLNDRTAAVLIEPIQGEGGINVPPVGYLKQVEQLCRARGVLLVVDEIQTGLGRTGKMFCYQHEDVHPDLVILGKALGGGLLPVSAVVGSEQVMGVFEPGDHGSTFGGNPLACAVATEALEILVEDRLAERSAALGAHAIRRLREAGLSGVREVRGLGLLIGIELEPDIGGADRVCEAMLHKGLLAKGTRRDVLRIAPPLVIDQATLDWGLDQLIAVLESRSI
jgi:ornithine--oxo-acid transaminase